MAKKGGADQPAVPDPAAVASAQGAANRETAIAQARLNQINETTPFGSSTYSPTGQQADGIDLYQREVTLAPDQQQLLGLQTGLNKQILESAGPYLQNITNTVSSPFNLEGLPNAPTLDDGSRQRVEDALMGRARAQLDPVYSDASRNLETRLAQQGFDVGSEGYRKALEDFNRSKGDAYQNATWNAIAQGGAEQSRLFGLEGSARERALQERVLERGQPLNEFATLLGQSGGVSLPQFGAIPQTSVAGTDVTGPTYMSYNANQANYQNAQNAQNAFIGELFGLAGKAAGAWASSEDYKTDIKPMSKQQALAKLLQVPVKEWSYKGDSQRNVGPIAEDWSAKFGGDGKTISPVTAFGVSMAAIQALSDKIDKLERVT